MLASLAVAALFARELDRRADAALKGQAAAVKSQGGVADILTTAHEGGATVIYFDRELAPSAWSPAGAPPEPRLGVWTVGQAAIRN